VTVEIVLPSSEEMDGVDNGPMHMSLSSGNLSHRNISGHG